MCNELNYNEKNDCTTLHNLHNLVNEHNTQKLLVAWFRKQYPDMANLFFSIPNGGNRDLVTARKMKDEGAFRGVPDLLLAVPASGLHGLFVELKTRGKYARPEQREIHGALEVQGYRVAVPQGYEAAKQAIEDYLCHRSTK